MRPKISPRITTVGFRLLFVTAMLAPVVLSLLLIGRWKGCPVLTIPSICLNLSADEAIKFIQSWGNWGIVGSIALMVLHTVLPFPAEIITLANGMVFGPFWGVIITWTGAMIGAFLGFGLSRMFGMPLIKTLLPKRRWEKLEEWSYKRSTVELLLSRLIPLISFNLINYAAGLTAVSWWTFAWTTALGILPMTVLMVLLGDRFMVIPSWFWLALLSVLVIAWYLSRKK